MSPFDAVILGIVEGITEFLPISSTGHLILASYSLGLSQDNFQKTFEIAIQLGAILAVVVLYFRAFFHLEVLKRLAIAFLPTGVIGLVLYRFVKTYLLGNEWVVLAAIGFGGLALIIFELAHTDDEDASARIEEISYKQSFLIGLCQAVAIVPGISRAAATIVGGLMLGIRRVTVVEFSFLLAVPTMAAATGLDLVKSVHLFSADQIANLTIGFIISFVVAILSIKFLLSYVRKHTFIPFGLYRIALALVFVFILLR